MKIVISVFAIALMLAGCSTAGNYPGGSYAYSPSSSYRHKCWDCAPHRADANPNN